MVMVTPFSAALWISPAQYFGGMTPPRPSGGAYCQRWTVVLSRPSQSATALLPPQRLTMSEAGFMSGVIGMIMTEAHAKSTSYDRDMMYS